MSKERYNQIIDDAYKNYCKKADEGTFSRKWLKLKESFDGFFTNEEYSLYTQEEFINNCKTNTEFSEKWGLNIEERELSEKERIIFAGYDYENGGGIGWNMIRETVDMDNSIPRKLITITYNNEKIESYE